MRRGRLGVLLFDPVQCALQGKQVRRAAQDRRSHEVAGARFGGAQRRRNRPRRLCSRGLYYFFNY